MNTQEKINFLLTHNKNYTKEQYNLLDEIKDDLKGLFDIINDIEKVKNKIQDDLDLSYMDLITLQENQNIIKIFFADDVELWETAGIDESEWENK